ncbi:hypothetical protein C8R47DRAFT_661499 [Mycena vitilis]|nr:hypothetical protein C8R47DRAFT_661499 [Mycena vitilis]
MSHGVRPTLALIFELLFAFLTASLIVLAILYITPWPAASQFSVAKALEIIFACTLVVFAGARAAGVLWWWYHAPGFTPRRDSSEVQTKQGDHGCQERSPYVDAKSSGESVMV